MDFIDKLKELAHTEEIRQHAEGVADTFFDIIEERHRKKIQERHIAAKTLAIANRAETMNMAWVTAQLLSQKDPSQLKRESWIETKTVREKTQWFRPAVEVEKTRLVFEGFRVHLSGGRYVGDNQIVSLTLDEQEENNHLAIYTSKHYDGEPEEDTIAPLSHIPLEGNEPRWTVIDRRRKAHFRDTYTDTRRTVIGQGDQTYRGWYDSIHSGQTNFEVYNATNQEQLLQRGIAHIALRHDINLGAASTIRNTAKSALVLARDTLEKLRG